MPQAQRPNTRVDVAEIASCCRELVSLAFREHWLFRVFADKKTKTGS